MISAHFSGSIATSKKMSGPCRRYSQLVARFGKACSPEVRTSPRALGECSVRIPWCYIQQTDVIVLTKKWPLGTSRLFLPNQQVSEATRDSHRKPNLSYLLKSETQHIRHSAINLLIRFFKHLTFQQGGKDPFLKMAKHGSMETK